MSTINLCKHPIRSIEEAKAAAFVLERELKVIDRPPNHSKLLEVVAKLCGAHHFNELRQRLGAAGSAKEVAGESRAPATDPLDGEGFSKARIKELDQQLNSARSVISTLYHALDDASGVVDAGEGEDYAYQAELESGASFLGLRRE